MNKKVLAIVAVAVTLSLLTCCCGVGLFAALSSGGSGGAKVAAARGSDDVVKLTALQLSLEETVWSYQRAMALTALTLSSSSSDTKQAEWERMYAEAVGTWAHTAEVAARFEALCAKVPDRPVPAAPESTSGLPRAARALASRASAVLAPSAAYALEPDPATLPPVDMGQVRVTEDDSVALSDSQRKEALATLAERVPPVLAFESAPSGSKLAAAARAMGGDAQRAQDVLEGNYQEMRASFNRDEKRAEIAWRTATAIEGASDVALFVGDLATGGGKVALTKSLSKTLLKRLVNPKLLARAAREQLREKYFTTIIGNCDLVVGLLNKGIVIATGDDSACFSLTGDSLSGLSTLIGVKSLSGDKGWIDNLSKMSKSPGGWKTAFGWGATAASLGQKGVNYLEAAFGDDGATLTPEKVDYSESPDDPDPAQYALRAAEPALTSIMAEGSTFDARYEKVMSAWSSRETFGVKLGEPDGDTEVADGGDSAGAGTGLAGGQGSGGYGGLTEKEIRQAYADWLSKQFTEIYRAMANGGMLNEQRPDAAERWVRITPNADGTFQNIQGNSKGEDMNKPLEVIPWAPTYQTFDAWAQRQDPDRFRDWSHSGFSPDVWKGRTSGAKDLR